MQRFDLYQEEYHASPLENVWIEFKRSHLAVVGLIFIIIFLLITVLVPIVAPYNPDLQNTNALLLPPAWEASGSVSHLLGTDALGRDVFSRLLYGIRVTLGSSLFIVFVAMIIGVGVGALAGLLRGVRSSIVNHLFDSIMSIPTLLIAIIVVAIMGTGLYNSMFAITLALIPQFIHQTRSFVKEELSKDYVLLDKLDGAGSVRIFFTSILPGMFELIVIQATIALSIAILDISALGFLSLGAQNPTIELGQMLSQSLNAAYVAPWLIALPGLVIFMMVLSVNIVGEGLRSALRNRFKH
ncbi:peptide transport system permease protein sapC [Glaciecola punicea ACAM 611]|uniref:Peptide transport system permease protein sapC n=1 Tax=Glaciecola punicea ACAM 611 TaxID=1121923 RepID=H5TBA5_9ALTE|nr:ABC transporter permease subunit [Glaciecola punicea]OFA30043.1 peptide ABC transporter permease [Glaciecola punicea]GAB55582.1 peptide transport system permease protein sapC [Glaciecola punicea ACAM 611]